MPFCPLPQGHEVLLGPSSPEDVSQVLDLTPLPPTMQVVFIEQSRRNTGQPVNQQVVGRQWFQIIGVIRCRSKGPIVD